ncbi:AraC family transcriptional regulator [Paenibacillus hamazuiensis]|uniref:AraC family transcriptional regulator n=1 Tax=Paenibacillus hamazuiensis TaxID=2936508 RepID=UPI0020107A6C|nr:AraC family transcriptional regulator [Paenibacillus hamazuiensis]
MFPFKNQGKLYSRLFLTMTMTVTITIAAVSSLLYINFERLALGLVHNYDKDSLLQVSYSATLMNDSVKVLALQAYFDPLIAKLLYRKAAPDELTEALARLTAYRNTSPFIDSIYIYNASRDVFYSTLVDYGEQRAQDFFDSGIVQTYRARVQGTTSIKPFLPIPRLMPNPYKPYTEGESRSVYSYLFSDSDWSSGIPQEAIVINVSAERMNSIIAALESGGQKNTFIIDKEGHTVTAQAGSPVGTDRRNDSVIERILGSRMTSGFFVEQARGEKALVSYISHEPNGWIFVRVTPYGQVLAQLTQWKQWTFGLAALILLLGVAGAFLLSRKLFQPIGRMMTELSGLKTEKRSMHALRLQELMKSLLLGEQVIPAETLRKKLAELDHPFTDQGSFCLLLMKLDHHAAFCESYPPRDRQLLKFGIGNIARELSKPYARSNVVELEEDSLVLILQLRPVGPGEANCDLVPLSRSIQEAVRTYIRQSTSIVISPPVSSLQQIDLLYQEVQEGAAYRVYAGHECVIDVQSEVRSRKEAETYEYPQHLEKRLTDAMMLGKPDAVMEGYRAMVEDAASYEPRVLRMMLTRLLLALEDTSRARGNGPEPFHFPTCMSEMAKLETLTDIHAYFTTRLERCMLQSRTRQQDKYEELLQQIQAYVGVHYSNPALSIEQIAEQVNMSPVYLGRLYKKLTSQSFSDYVNEVRLNEVKKLLAETDEPIVLIMEKAGFVSQGYFFTLFKKMNGLTPGEYRERNRKCFV